ncbi:hypothetical protein [Streptomyces ureilyticus]|jgi:hypothetical protein|uniref:Uncharacterized protein n=1 Tax=Streptomyces ureilyticus TaxID=1775131 RepID=A0ABX0E4H4_9ACTN|nr:hypothetical protein [Streptomyces ureilyticus]NGO49116.1 hypothetical protein [Streptomyces ureilyticus]
MSQEAVPPSQPKGLLQQMEELMAALNADLSELDADLQQSAPRPDASPTDGSEPA